MRTAPLLEKIQQCWFGLRVTSQQPRSCNIKNPFEYILSNDGFDTFILADCSCG